ncbi:hypothetical protein D0Z00_002207 [Geotrichum galactomycetum]|uniref:Uncharacterized protein n=1 Tax=Geotrichum galactomycetum TaxID=27317 RepID=A0ACB6V4U3_9ASCO|nr:hypothetical protein D0Z00_002207 [Geotrichum candidum]
MFARRLIRLPSIRAFSISATCRHTGPTTGASSDELAHFAELADTWWDVGGSQRILHKMNLLRMDFIQQTLRNNWKTVPNSNFEKSTTDDGFLVPGFSLDLFPRDSEIRRKSQQRAEQETQQLFSSAKFEVLDVGCGGGIVAECLARQPYTSRVRGIDLSPDVLKVAQAHRETDPILVKKLDYRLIELEKLKENNEQYDIITMFEMLEHVPYPSEVLKEALNLLKPGGLLFLSTINRTFVSYFTTIFMGEDVLKVVPKGTHTLSKYINEHELRAWFGKRSDCDVLASEGCLYIPGVGWKISGPVQMGNYLMSVRKRAN